MPQKWALFECRFSTPTLTHKIENNQKTKTDVHNYDVSSIQIIWLDSLALALSEPLSDPKKIFKWQKLVTRCLYLNKICID